MVFAIKKLHDEKNFWPGIWIQHIRNDRSALWNRPLFCFCVRAIKKVSRPRNNRPSSPPIKTTTSRSVDPSFPFMHDVFEGGMQSLQRPRADFRIALLPRDPLYVLRGIRYIFMFSPFRAAVLCIQTRRDLRSFFALPSNYRSGPGRFYCRAKSDAILFGLA